MAISRFTASFPATEGAPAGDVFSRGLYTCKHNNVRLAGNAPAAPPPRTTDAYLRRRSLRLMHFNAHIRFVFVLRHSFT
eukprot:31486-Pelagococcus_subviridis.AAC.14